MDENMFLEGTLSPTVSSCSSVRFSIFAIKDKTSIDLEALKGIVVMGVMEISEDRKVDSVSGGEVVRTDVRSLIEDSGRGVVGRGDKR